MKKVFLKMYSYLYLFKCKLLLSRLSTFIGADTKVLSTRDFLKLYKIIYQLYWIPFTVDAEDEDPYQGTILLLEDWLYYLNKTEIGGYLHPRITPERMDDNFTHIIKYYVSDYKYEVKKHDYELANYLTYEHEK